MLHGKVLRSPSPTPGSSPSTPRPREAMPGVVARPHRRRPAGHRPVLGPRHQGPADRRHRPGALRGRAGRGRRGRDRGHRRGRRRARSWSSTRSCRSWARSTRRSRRTRRWSTTRRSRPGLFHGLGTLADARRQRLLPLRIDRGDVDAVFAHADIVVEGEYTFPGVYQYAMETHTVIAQVERRRDHALGDLPAPVPGARRDRRRCSTCRWARCASSCRTWAAASAASRTPRWSPSRSRSRARPAGPCGSSEPRRRVDGHDAPPRPPVRMRTAADGGRPPAGARRRVLVRHRRLRRQRPARRPPPAATPRPGPYRWAAVRVDAACVYTNTAPSGSYRAFGASHLQWVGELQVDEVARRAGIDALEIRRRNLLRPGEQVRPGGKPLDADLVGDVEKVAAALGWDEDEAARHRAAASRSACSRPAPTRCRAPSCAWRRTARRSCSSAPPRWARASAPRSRRSRRRCWACRPSASAASAPTPASRPTTARPAPAAPRRSPGLAVQRAAQRGARDLLDIARASGRARAGRSSSRRRRLVRR